MTSSPPLHDHPRGHDPRLALTARDRELLDPQELLQAYLEELTDQDVLSALQAMPEAFRRTLLTPMKLRNVPSRRVNLPMAAHIRRYLSGQHKDRAYGVMLLTAPGSVCLSRCACWPLVELQTVAASYPEALLALASREPDIGMIHTAVGRSPAVLRRLGLAASYAEEHDGSAMAVGWLLAEDHIPAAVVQRLHAVWANVRDRLPELPEKVRPLTEVIELCDPQVLADWEDGYPPGERDAELTRQPQEDQDPPAAGVQSTVTGPAAIMNGTQDDPMAVEADVPRTTVSDAADQPAPAAPVTAASGPEQLDAAEGQLHRVQDLLEQGRRASTAIAAALTGQRAPARRDLRILGALADEFDALVTTFATDEFLPVSLPEAAERLSELRAAAGAAGTREQLLRLTEVTAPEYLAAATVVVRDLAARAVTPDTDVEVDDSVTDGLLALVDVIDLVASIVGQPTAAQSEQVTGSQQVALSNLPPTASGLVLSAGTGVVQLPPAAHPAEDPHPYLAATDEDALVPAGAADPAGLRAEGALLPDTLPTSPAPDPAGIPDLPDLAADPTGPADTPDPSDRTDLGDLDGLGDLCELGDLDALLEQAGLDPLPTPEPAAPTSTVPAAAEAAVDQSPLDEPPTAEPTPAAALSAPTAPDGTTNDVPDEATEPAVSDTTADTPDPADSPVTLDPAQFTDTHAQLLRRGDYALAAWLAQTTGGTAASVAARRTAAYSVAMRSSTGGCALAYADQLRDLSADGLTGDPAGTLVAFAGAIRAGLLSPAAGAAGVLRELAPALSHASALSTVNDAFLAAFYRGSYLTPGSADTVAGFAELEAHRAQLADTARDTLETGPARTIRYQLATEVWTNWISADGDGGAALTLLAADADDDDSLSTVRELVLRLRTRGLLDKDIDEQARRHGQPGQAKKIMGPARARLEAMILTVVDVLADWVEVSERLQSLRGSSAHGWQAGPLAELRSKVTPLREQALTELAAFGADGDDVTAAAVTAASDLLRGSFALLDGQPLPGEEPDPERVANAQLLLAADLRLSADLQPATPVTTADVLEAASRASRGERGWQSAFDVRSGRGDHIGTQAILEMLRTLDPVLATSLASYRDTQVLLRTEQLATEVDALGRRIDADRRYARIDTAQWSDFAARQSGLRPEGRRDFDALHTAAQRLEHDRAAAVQVRIDAETARLTDRAATDPAVAAVAPVIQARIDAADLTTAAEYLELASSGRPLPTSQDRVDHLRRFFPAFPAAFAPDPARQVKGGRDNRRLGTLRDALENGTDPTDPVLAQLLTTADLPVPALETRRRLAAATGLSRWEQLADARRLGGQFTTLKGVLALLGFEADAESTPAAYAQAQHGRAWAHLTGVRATGKALVPAFGSAISPSGGTLRVLACWALPTPAQLTDLLREEPNDESVLVLYFGTMDPAARRTLSEACRRRRQPVMIVVDDAVIAYLACQPEASRETTMKVTLPFTAVNPYSPDVAGLVPPEVYYGRTEEMFRITSMMGSCLVTGGRQLGKSASLRSAERDFDDSTDRFAVYLSIYPVGRASAADTIWTTLWPKLADKGIVPDRMPTKGDVGAAVVEHIRSWAQPGKQLLLLLDEADRFLDADSSDGKFTHVARFRDLMDATERRVKVVFAGLHQTARFERLGNHPLAHFGGPVVIGPLEPQPAYDLLTLPLDALGFRFADDALAARVLALANNQPALIQLFGSALLNRLHRAPLPAGAPPQLITDADIDAVWMDQTLRAEFRKRFDWTLNLDPRYKVIAYVVAEVAHTRGVDQTLSASQLRRLCEQRWPVGFADADLRTDEFRALLNEAVDLGVLSYASGGYRLRTPNVLELLGSREEVDEVLESAGTFDLPESFDGSQYRSAFPEGGPTRSPLTEEQVADVLAARNQVRVVIGSSALTLERVPTALEQANRRGAAGGRAVPWDRVSGKGGRLDATCAKVSSQGGDGHAVVVCELRGATLERAFTDLAAAREQITTHAHGSLGVVVVAGPELAPLWLTAARSADASSGLTELRRFDLTGLRLWLSETHLPFQDDASRAELLKVTGGWPSLINRIADAFDNRDTTRGHDPDPLADARAYIAGLTGARALEHDSGVRALPALSAAWDLLVALTETDGTDADPDTLAELLSDLADDAAGPDGTSALSELALKEAGFTSTADIVEALRMLGALSPTGDATFTCEPVLATATRTLQAAG